MCNYVKSPIGTLLVVAIALLDLLFYSVAEEVCGL
jgi:hypothetical protein